MKWLLYKRGTIHPYRADMIFRAIFRYSKKLTGQFVGTLYINEGPLLKWSWDEKQLLRLAKIVIKKCSTPASFARHYKKLRALNARAILATEKVRVMDLRKIDSRGLLRIYDFLDRQCLPARAVLDIDVDAFDMGTEDYLFDKFKKELPKSNEKTISEIYKNLFRPLYQSYIIRQDREMIRVALKKRVSSSDIKKVYKKFWWTKLGWENVEPHTENHFIKQIKVFKRKSRISLIKRLKEIEGQLTEIKKERDKLVKKYNLSREIKHWLIVLDKYNLLHEERKETQGKTVYAYYLLLKEVARRFNLKMSDLEWLWHDEAKGLLKGEKLDLSEIARRKKNVALLVDEHGIKFWSGPEAIKVEKRELKIKIPSVKEIRGKGVSAGKVKGIAKVCNGAVEALSKMKKGDILVCPMTLPDYVLAIKLAAAIVTDEGGLTVHAAIISRELGIPCIVGTKIATRVLRDGQLVEVDANKGVVKILEK